MIQGKSRYQFEKQQIHYHWDGIWNPILRLMCRQPCMITHQSTLPFWGQRFPSVDLSKVCINGVPTSICHHQRCYTCLVSKWQQLPDNIPSLWMQTAMSDSCYVIYHSKSKRYGQLPLTSALYAHVRIKIIVFVCIDKIVHKRPHSFLHSTCNNGEIECTDEVCAGEQ